MEIQKEKLKEWRAKSLMNKMKVPAFGSSNNSTTPHVDFISHEKFRTSFVEWADFVSNMKGAITSIITGMTKDDMGQEVLDILKKLRNYDANTASYNLVNGDIVRTPDGTQKYQVQDVTTGLVTLEDGTPLNIDFKNMQKEETDCHPTLWNIL